MHSPNDITINYTQITNNEDGEPVPFVSNFNINCYVDFSSAGLKFQKDGENIVCKFVIFVTIAEEIEKLSSINKSNMQKYSILHENNEYNLLNFERGIKHIQIFI